MRLVRSASALLATVVVASAMSVPAAAEPAGPSIGNVSPEGEAFTAWTQVTALPPDLGLGAVQPVVLHEGSSSVVYLQELDLGVVPQTWLDANGDLVNVAVHSAMVPADADVPADSDVETLMNEAVWATHHATLPVRSKVNDHTAQVYDVAVAYDPTGRLAKLMEASQGYPVCQQLWTEIGREIPDNVPIGEIHTDSHTEFTFTATNVSASRFEVGYKSPSDLSWGVDGTMSVGNTVTTSGSFSRGTGSVHNHDFHISVEYIKEAGQYFCWVSFGGPTFEQEIGDRVRPVKHRANPRQGDHRYERLYLHRACEKGYSDPIDRNARIRTANQRSHNYKGEFSVFGASLGSEVTYSATTALDIRVRGNLTAWNGKPLTYYQWGDTAAIVDGPKAIHQARSTNFDHDTCTFV